MFVQSLQIETGTDHHFKLSLTKLYVQNRVNEFKGGTLEYNRRSAAEINIRKKSIEAM